MQASEFLQLQFAIPCPFMFSVRIYQLHLIWRHLHSSNDIIIKTEGLTSSIDISGLSLIYMQASKFLHMQFAIPWTLMFSVQTDQLHLIWHHLHSRQWHHHKNWRLTSSIDISGLSLIYMKATKFLQLHITCSLVRYSLHLIFFVAYERIQYSRVLPFIRLERPASNKQSSLLGPFISYGENNVLWKQSLIL